MAFSGGEEIGLLLLQERLGHLLLDAGFLYYLLLDHYLRLGLVQLLLIVVALTIFSLQLLIILLHPLFQVIDLRFILLQVGKQFRLDRLQMGDLVSQLLHLATIVKTIRSAVAVLNRLTVALGR